MSGFATMFVLELDVQRMCKVSSIGGRIVVLGVSGSGKSTLAKILAERFDLYYIELDNLFWKANWQESTDDEFLVKVDEQLAKSERWIVDGNYIGRGASRIWQYADTLIWLDYPLRVNLWRLWKRTWGRFFRREALWDAGNKENLWKHFFTRDSLFLYAIQSHPRKRKDYTKLMRATEFESHHKIHLKSPQETNQWLDTMKREGN